LVEESSEFEVLVAPFRRELLAHSYQMLGSAQDAEDAVQETLMRAWRAWDRYDPARASVRTWVHTIVTNTCLNHLAARKRRVLPSGLGPAARDVEHALVPADEVSWVGPIPSSTFDVDPDDPAAALVRNGRIRLAFIVALQTLSPRQRSVLVLREVLGFSAAEVAAMIDASPAAVNSALQRARAALAQRGPVEDAVTDDALTDDAGSDLLTRYTDAFVRADVVALRELLVEDAVMEMPPVPLWYRGRDDFVGFMSRAYRMRGTDWRVVHVRANGQLAFAAYSRGDGDYAAHSIQLLDTTAGAVTRNVVFFDRSLFGLFGLPEVITDRS
jgi:RNA polymerase sigma-70 factor (ECF subfamily)